jgi:hypothetical protein
MLARVGEISLVDENKCIFKITVIADISKCPPCKTNILIVR